MDGSTLLVYLPVKIDVFVKNCSMEERKRGPDSTTFRIETITVLHEKIEFAMERLNKITMMGLERVA